MKQSLNWIISLGIGCLLVAGCQATSTKTPQSKTGVAQAAVPKPDKAPAHSGDAFDDSDSEDDNGFSPSVGSPESLAHFAAGVSHALNDESDAALNEFYQAALADPTNEPIVIEVSRTLIAKKQSDKAIALT